MKTINNFIPEKKKLAPAILFITLLVTINNAAATNYYISVKGKDTDNGVSPAAPWASIQKVNNTKFLPGDSILFKRGDAWREGQALFVLSDGTPTRPIVFGAYGKGDKPLILASKNISAAEFWTQSEGHIWKTTSKINITTRDFNLPGAQYRQIVPDVANLVFNNETSVGVKKRFLPDLKSQGDFCLNLDDTLLYLYSDTNPSEYYKRIEATGIRNAENNIEVINRRNLVFVNLDIRYSKNNGIFLLNCKNVEISNCDFSWIGGCYFPINTFMTTQNPSPGRMGNGIQLWKGNADITIHNCNINQVYDAGISPQGAGSVYALRNIRIHHNLISNCFYSFEFWGHEANSTADSVFFENNTCVNSGSGWSTDQRPDKTRCAHLQFSANNLHCANIFIRNNIFAGSVCFCSDGKAESDGANTDAVWAGFTMDYNCYFQGSGQKQLIRWRGGTAKGGGDFFKDDLKKYREKTGKELHTIFSDPMLSPNYTLQTGSPAIDAGTDAGYPFSGKAPDLGAFESGSNDAPSRR